MRRNAGVLEHKRVVAFPMVRSPEGKTSTAHVHEAPGAVEATQHPTVFRLVLGTGVQNRQRGSAEG